jgi:porphobilinogen deaminase
MMRIEGMVADPETGEILRASEIAEPEQAEWLGEKLAQKMISMGAMKIIEKARQK